MLISDSNLELGSWTAHIASDINSVLADAIQPELIGAALEVVIAASKPYGGGLVSLDRPVPIVNGMPLPYCGVDFEITPSAEAAALNRNYECDLKVCWPPAPDPQTEEKNVADLSAQLNLAEGGIWQIDSPTYSWTDSGYKPGPLPAGVPTLVKLRYKIDWTGKTSSVLSIAQGSDPPFQIPAGLQAIPLQTTNWASYDFTPNTPEPLAKIQIQLDDNDAPGAYSSKYKVNLYWSDAAF